MVVLLVCPYKVQKILILPLVLWCNLTMLQMCTVLDDEDNYETTTNIDDFQQFEITSINQSPAMKTDVERRSTSNNAEETSKYEIDTTSEVFPLIVQNIVSQNQTSAHGNAFVEYDEVNPAEIIDMTCPQIKDKIVKEENNESETRWNHSHVNQFAQHETSALIIYFPMITNMKILTALWRKIVFHYNMNIRQLKRNLNMRIPKYDKEIVILCVWEIVFLDDYSIL
ncbi:unnamed protein product [Mytilus coruscus]|uniref:Uncharacterized protein n=1 Tax=Mytilus coruscus TaxID=42192 RepID=A0A6J8C3T7_MYTCO|nr:unnamed protein product [Mytilus coruscus]